MANRNIASDAELAAKASDLEAKLAAIPERIRDGNSIEVGNIRAKVNAVVERLVATERIKLGDITAETGDARLSDLAAGAEPKKPERGRGGHSASRNEGRKPNNRSHFRGHPDRRYHGREGCKLKLRRKNVAACKGPFGRQ